MKGFTFIFPCLLLAGCANHTAMTPEQRFQKADANSSGSVSRSEATNLMIAEAFGMYDTNGDGKVTEAEFLVSGGSRANFRKINSSGSGAISLSEAQASPLVFNTFAVGFDEADANRDGQVTLAEYLAYLELRNEAVR